MLPSLVLVSIYSCGLKAWQRHLDAGNVFSAAESSTWQISYTSSMWHLFATFLRRNNFCMSQKKTGYMGMKGGKTSLLCRSRYQPRAVREQLSVTFLSSILLKTNSVVRMTSTWSRSQKQRRKKRLSFVAEVAKAKASGECPVPMHCRGKVIICLMVDPSWILWGFGLSSKESTKLFPFERQLL